MQTATEGSYAPANAAPFFMREGRRTESHCKIETKPPDECFHKADRRPYFAGTLQRGRFDPMSHVTYSVVEHDGGWAYKVGDVFSETFRTREAAHAAAARAAQEQRTPGESGPIEFEDSAGRWHEEDEKGDDRPDADVKD
jgi:hypothetical protein